MTNLPQTLRRALDERFDLVPLAARAARESRDGTIKILAAARDGKTLECVLIPEAERWTACLSSQVGCPIGCRFCASGVLGLDRGLSAGEIVGQFLLLRERLGGKGPRPRPSDGDADAEREQPTGGARIRNVVLMGMGEPLLNYDAVLKAIRILNAPWGGGVGARRITLSTVGITKRFADLAAEELQIHLAISLHAPNDEVRMRIVPTSRPGDVERILEAARAYYGKTGRQISFEYALLGGVNDEPAHAEELARRIRDLKPFVNLIPWNPVEGLPFGDPDPARVQRFLSILEKAGIASHIRRRKGADIEGACGQLRIREMNP